MTTPQQHSASGQAIATDAREEVRAFIGKLWQYVPAETDSPQIRSRKRAALAALRRGLGKAPGEATEMFPYIIPILPESARGWREEACYLIASLFALYPPERGARVEANFGLACRRLAEETHSDSTERRFLALLDAPREALPDHLRHAIGQMANPRYRIPVDWFSLLSDILSWDAGDRWVQRKWARGFYTTSGATNETSRQTTNDHQ